MGLEMVVEGFRQIQRQKIIKAGIGGEAVDSPAVGDGARRRDRLRLHQSILAPDALTMRPQRAWSCRMTSANSFGVLVHGSKACRLRRWRISGARIASMS